MPFNFTMVCVFGLRHWLKKVRYVRVSRSYTFLLCPPLEVVTEDLTLRVQDDRQSMNDETKQIAKPRCFGRINFVRVPARRARDLAYAVVNIHLCSGRTSACVVGPSYAQHLGRVYQISVAVVQGWASSNRKGRILSHVQHQQKETDRTSSCCRTNGQIRCLI